MEPAEQKLVTYILKYYGGLMTKQEKEYVNYLNGIRQINLVETNESLSEEKKEILIKKINKEYGVNNNDFLISERSQRLLRISNRIIQENPDQVVINRCPMCGTLARTPQTKQCRLGHTWD